MITRSLPLAAALMLGACHAPQAQPVPEVWVTPAAAVMPEPSHSQARESAVRVREYAKRLRDLSQQLDELGRQVDGEIHRGEVP